MSHLTPDEAENLIKDAIEAVSGALEGFAVYDESTDYSDVIQSFILDNSPPGTECEVTFDGDSTYNATTKPAFPLEYIEVTLTPENAGLTEEQLLNIAADFDLDALEEEIEDLPDED